MCGHVPHALPLHQRAFQLGDGITAAAGRRWRFELLDRPLAHRQMRQDRRRQRREEMAGDLLIVIADHGNVLRDMQAGFLQRLVAADRGAVVLAEDRGGSLLEPEQLDRRGIAGAGRPVALDHQLRIERDVGGGQGTAIAFQPILRGLHPRFAGDRGDAAMAVGDQMPRRTLAAGDLGGNHGREGIVGGVTVEQDDRDVEAIEEVRRGDLAGEDGHVDQRRDAAPRQRRNRPRFHHRVAHGLRHQKHIAGVPRSLSRALDGDHRLGAGGELVDCEADDAVQAFERRHRRPERRKDRRRIAQRSSCLDDPVSGLLRQPDTRRIVEHERDRRLRAAGGARDVGHGDAPLGLGGRLAAPGSPGRVAEFRRFAHGRFPNPAGSKAKAAATARWSRSARLSRWRRLIYISKHNMQITGYDASRRNQSDKVNNADNSCIFGTATGFAALVLLTPGVPFDQRLLRFENTRPRLITNTLY
ncbi:hypothetical protein MPL3356_30177 [Mesorhizobium plurifarium]|uniref:Uncharacterized protein n=1 Tax=Mesorhizobium plurifarium TaxID=69974 RepID=A0A090DYE1_MESPL|nr:hypothetical protein MPL3356_30177 [Mesorhizobium plurifarium]